MTLRGVAFLCAVAFLGAGLLLAVGQTGMSLPQQEDQMVKRAQELQDQGNYAEALELYRKLVLSPQTSARQVPQALRRAWECLAHLGREDELDGLLEAAVATHGQNWRLLRAAAQLYWEAPHFGVIIAGQFYRGQRRGGGEFVGSFERDRVRALQLMQQAMPLALAETEARAEVGGFFLEFAEMILGGRFGRGAWRLQYLTDLAKLPDFEPGRLWWGDDAPEGAPVDDQGNPIFYAVPKSWEAAENDGQRWRWCLTQAAECDAKLLPSVQLMWADFLRSQFDVHTLAFFQWRWLEEPDEKQPETGTFALHTLEEDETICRLATGVKRLRLPAEFNFLRIYQQLAETAPREIQAEAIRRLAESFENRRQYPKAAQWWKKLLAIVPAPQRDEVTQRIKQIEGNWGRFEPVLRQPAGKGAEVEFRFRNGREVQLTAQEILVDKLLADIKDRIKRGGREPDWQFGNFEQLGWLLIHQKQEQYVGPVVAQWTVPLEPRPNHFDSRITIATPLQKPGAYLLTARMKDGNTSQIVIWVVDTAILEKRVDKGTWYYVADSRTGEPIGRANVEFFGYRVRWEDLGRPPRVDFKQFAELTNAEGQLVLTGDRLPQDYLWLVIARAEPRRMAFLGFSHVWMPDWAESFYEAVKTFTMTDRPVYRPGQTVHFKAWIAQARYDAPDRSPFAGRKIHVELWNPKGEKIWEKDLEADAYGGVEASYDLPADATLGVYGIRIGDWGGGSFRVEEYKKPEFEVLVEAPEEPVALGEVIKAKIKANYYFGAPVTEAKVKYKVYRTSHTARWYPPAPWDWLYGPGYWWFAYDYVWYPGWGDWGCPRPMPFWWRGSAEAPELVASREVSIRPDGTVEVEIDTSVAKAIFPDRDHAYRIVAEVTDQSRRTIVGEGTVLVARKPFKVYVWIDRGYLRVGEVFTVSAVARRLDGKPVAGEGKLALYRVRYLEAKPQEELVFEQGVTIDESGQWSTQLKAGSSGQFRLAVQVSDSQGHTIEGGYVFTVIGDQLRAEEYQFNELELVPDRREYQPGQTVQLQVNSRRAGAAVLLFIRPARGVYLPPQLLRLPAKSRIVPIEVKPGDMPNFFVEAVTVLDGRVYTEVREIHVPPERRVMEVELIPSKATYRPAEPATIQLRVRDLHGKPVVGSCVVTIYDKALEYIAGGSNVPAIKEFFWKWRRHHQPWTRNNLDGVEPNLVPPGEPGMANLGLFGETVVEELAGVVRRDEAFAFGKAAGRARRAANALGALELRAAPMAAAQAPPAPGAVAERQMAAEADRGALAGQGGAAPQEPALVQPMIRQAFADTALWVGAIETNSDGIAEVKLQMPENLTTWKVRVWSMGLGTRVGEATTEVITRKDLIVRLQAPRFFVEKDEVVLSANVHNYLSQEKEVQVALELEGGTLRPIVPDGTPEEAYVVRKVRVPAGGEVRVDWRVAVVAEGQATVRMKALTDEESDAMQMSFPCYVHGMLKMDSFCGVIRPEEEQAVVTFRVPAERRPEQTRLEVRWSPTLAGALVDALPYLVDYPYGCVEQTLNRFLPTVIVQKILIDMGVDLEAVRNKQVNLNPQELGAASERARQWQRYQRNPVFDRAEVDRMVKVGVQRLTEMQLSDGGWGWFSGWGEYPSPHMTALVVHGLLLAQRNDVAIVPDVLERGIQWLVRYQEAELAKLENALKDPKVKPWKDQADNIDALVYMVLVEAGHDQPRMREFLYRDRLRLTPYAMAMVGLACDTVGDVEKRDMIIRNLRQFVMQDDENQTAWLRLPGGIWWYWYGDEIETQAYFLKLLVRTEPRGELARRLVKYLLTNRKHATYWNSTRDTAVCIEAMAEFLRASGEAKPEMTVEVLLDGKLLKAIEITAANLFTFDNALVLEGEALTTGEHRLEFRKRGTGPLYFNAYLTNFSLEEYIPPAGLEIKVERKYYRLRPVDAERVVAGGRGQLVRQQVEKYERELLPDLSLLKSGELVEIELEIDSKNDYEYLVFEDMKPAGFEPVDLRSGYIPNPLGAYIEFRDNRVVF
ncbi:MAG: MG2 domain-containing protein, partial [Thermoguttaceae bacterium]|nr:MG2 domain-containing protein [Thermoguttaceae bacterium]